MRLTDKIMTKAAKVLSENKDMFGIDDKQINKALKTYNTMEKDEQKKTVLSMAKLTKKI